MGRSRCMIGCWEACFCLVHPVDRVCDFQGSWGLSTGCNYCNCHSYWTSLLLSVCPSGWVVVPSCSKSCSHSFFLKTCIECHRFLRRVYQAYVISTFPTDPTFVNFKDLECTEPLPLVFISTLLRDLKISPNYWGYYPLTASVIKSHRFNRFIN